MGRTVMAVNSRLWQQRWRQVIERIAVVPDVQAERDLLNRLVQRQGFNVVAFVNAHAMNLMVDDAEFYRTLMAADLLLRDGSGMQLLCRLLGMSAGVNMNGTDFIPRILSSFRGRKVALWGTEEPYLSQAARRVEQVFGMTVVSAHHGFEWLDFYVDLCRAVQPDLVVLGMGMPKQEQLAQRLRDAGDGSLIVCGGAIIDFLGNKVKRAPLWMRRFGIEWLYRLAGEPRRLFKRYVVGNPSFILRSLQLVCARYE